MNALMTRLVIQQSAESTPQSSAPAVALASKEINKNPARPPTKNESDKSEIKDSPKLKGGTA
jgi:hypothetical protein